MKLVITSDGFFSSDISHKGLVDVKNDVKVLRLKKSHFYFFPIMADCVTSAFTQGNFLLLLCPPTSRPISQPRGSYPSLEAQIPVLRPKSQPQGPNPILRPKSHL